MMALVQIFLYMKLFHVAGQQYYDNGNDSHFFKSVKLNQAPCSLNNHCKYNGMIECDTIKELNVTNCALRKKDNWLTILNFYLENETRVDSNIISLIRFVKMTDFASSIFLVDVFNAIGLDLAFFEPLKQYSSHLNGFFNSNQLILNDGSFVLYYNKKILDTPETCNPQTYQALLAQDGTNVISFFDNKITFQDVKFPSQLCKYLFQNVSLQTIYVNTYMFTFMKNTEEPKNLNSSIKELIIQSVYRFELNAEFLDPDVFKELVKLTIVDSSVYKIQKDLFKDRFPSIKFISLKIKNLNGMVHGEAGVAWMKYLNLNRQPIDLSFNATYLTVSSDSAIQAAISEYDNYGIQVQFAPMSPRLPKNYSRKLFPYSDYQFPNEDFCLFYDFPLERLVFIQLKEIENISCTVAWLYRYQYLYEYINLTSLDKPLPSYCDFNKSIELCNIAPNRTTLYREDSYFLFFSLNQGLKAANTVLVDYTGRFACALGFVTNMLTVLTILYNYKRRKLIRTKPKNHDQEMVMLEQILYKYILINSILNSLYALMYLLDWTIPCDPVIPKAYSFSYLKCAVESYVLDTIGSVLKLMSNLSYLQISVNRFLLVGKNHPEWLITLSKVKIKTFLIVSFLFSLALSSVVYFQNSLFVFLVPDNDYIFSTEYLYKIYSITYDNNLVYHVFVPKINEIPLLSSFILVHDIFSYFLFCLFSLILDVLTVAKLREALKEKAKVKGKSDGEKGRKSERKSIMMVVLNSLTNFVFRAPELISIIFYYIVMGDGPYVFKMMCVTYSDCLLFVNFSKVFYIMSLCFQLFFYVKFNSVFRLSFKILIQRLYKKASD